MRFVKLVIFVVFVVMCAGMVFGSGSTPPSVPTTTTVPNGHPFSSLWGPYVFPVGNDPPQQKVTFLYGFESQGRLDLIGYSTASNSAVMRIKSRSNSGQGVPAFGDAWLYAKPDACTGDAHLFAGKRSNAGTMSEYKLTVWKTTGCAEGKVHTDQVLELGANNYITSTGNVVIKLGPEAVCPSSANCQ